MTTLTEVIILENLGIIGILVFANHKLTSVDIPDSVFSIAGQAFENS